MPTVFSLLRLWTHFRPHLPGQAIFRILLVLFYGCLVVGHAGSAVRTLSSPCPAPFLGLLVLLPRRRLCRFWNLLLRLFNHFFFGRTRRFLARSLFLFLLLLLLLFLLLVLHLLSPSTVSVPACAPGSAAAPPFFVFRIPFLGFLRLGLLRLWFKRRHCCHSGCWGRLWTFSRRRHGLLGMAFLLLGSGRR